MVQNTAVGAERSPSGDGPLGQRPPVREDQPACSLLFPAALPPPAPRRDLCLWRTLINACHRP